jgi:hypothetical protein
MGTIEKRAKEYAKKIWSRSRNYASVQKYSEQDFIAGAIAERNELLHWRDSKKGLPETDVEVLVMVHADGHTYDVMRYDKHGWWQKAPSGGWCAAERMPIAWRYIHEL